MTTSRVAPAVTVSVPGKVMLAGEYTVLEGGRALAACLDKHLIVRARRQTEGAGSFAGTSLWSEARKVTAAMSDDAEPLIAAVARGMQLFDLEDVAVRIDSELDVEHGVGSSSALRLGVLLAMEELARIRAGKNGKRTKDELWPTAREAYKLQRKAQERASGYDVAAQLLGGVVEFRSGPHEEAWPALATTVNGAQAALPQLVHLFVGGRGAPTAPVMKGTMEWLAGGGRMEKLAVTSEELVTAFEKAFVALGAAGHPERSEGSPAGRRDPSLTLRMTAAPAVAALAQACAAHRRILADAPHFPRDLGAKLASLGGCDKTWSFKTTGAGGEDALLVLGSERDIRGAASALRELGWQRLPAGFDSVGARITRGGGRA